VEAAIGAWHLPPFLSFVCGWGQQQQAEGNVVVGAPEAVAVASSAGEEENVIPEEQQRNRQRSGRNLASTTALASVSDLAMAVPSQTFYIPLPESGLFFDMFRQINGHQDAESAGQYAVRGDMVWPYVVVL
jgi:hypothetical protein